MAAVDLNRGTTGVAANLPESVASQVWRDAQEQSAVAQLGTSLSIPGNGLSIPLLTADVVADWVDETEEKPVSRPAFGNKKIKAYTLAVIVPVSNQFRRDADRLYAALSESLPGALAAKLDSTVFGGTAPGSNFDVLTDAEAVDFGADPVEAVEGILETVEAEGGVVDGFALSPQGSAALRAAKDNDGRPLFFDSYNNGGISQIMGAQIVRNRNLYKAGTPDQVGFAGEFRSNLFYGFVEGVSISISDQATITDGATQVNLWQRNMFAIRAEMEVGVAVRDLAKIVKLTRASGS